VTELLIVLGIALVGIVVARGRARRDRRLLEQSASQRSSLLLDEGEFAVWPIRWMVAARRPSRVVVRPGTISWTSPGHTQPDWHAAAGQVRFRVLRRSWWIDVTRVRLTSPDGTRHTLRVSREPRRPLGELDRPYEKRLEGYAALFVDELRRAGAVQDPA